MWNNYRLIFPAISKHKQLPLNHKPLKMLMKNSLRFIIESVSKKFIFQIYYKNFIIKPKLAENAR